MTIDEIITDIMRREGGDTYTYHPSDHGGATKYGITQNTLSDYRGYQVTVEEVQSLTKGTARNIYKKMYIKDPGFELIQNERLKVFLIDFGVNSGPTTAIRSLQFCVGTIIDGVIGSKTLAAIDEMTSEETYRRMVASRVRLYMGLALNEPEIRQFMIDHPRAQIWNLRGWMNRLMEFV